MSELLSVHTLGQVCSLGALEAPRALAGCSAESSTFLPPEILIRWFAASAVAVVITYLLDRVASHYRGSDTTGSGGPWRLLPFASATLAFIVVLGPVKESERWFESCYMPLTILPAVVIPGCLLLALGPVLFLRLRSRLEHGWWSTAAAAVAAIVLGVIVYSIGLRVLLPLLGFPPQLLNIG